MRQRENFLPVWAHPGGRQADQLRRRHWVPACNNIPYHDPIRASPTCRSSASFMTTAPWSSPIDHPCLQSA
jgi:hypothetical protein